ncbi:hypothetical protein ACLKA7_001814 [Drosophila subpalustris]
MAVSVFLPTGTHTEILTPTQRQALSLHERSCRSDPRMHCGWKWLTIIWATAATAPQQQQHSRNTAATQRSSSSNNSKSCNSNCSSSSSNNNSNSCNSATAETAAAAAALAAAATTATAATAVQQKQQQQQHTHLQLQQQHSRNNSSTVERHSSNISSNISSNNNSNSCNSNSCNRSRTAETAATVAHTSTAATAAQSQQQLSSNSVTSASAASAAAATTATAATAQQHQQQQQQQQQLQQQRHSGSSSNSTTAAPHQQHSSNSNISSTSNNSSAATSAQQQPQLSSNSKGAAAAQQQHSNNAAASLQQFCCNTLTAEQQHICTTEAIKQQQHQHSSNSSITAATAAYLNLGAVGERLPTRSSIKNRWKSYCSESLDTQVFASMLTDLAGEVNPESMTEKVMSKVQEACDASMRSRRPYNRHHEPVYWWTESIADARRVCIRARRRYQRSRGRPTFLEHQATFQSARRTLKKAIRDSKRKCFLDLCDAAEHDPWGRAYKIVAKKLNANGNSVPSDPLSMRRIVEHLFPTCSESGGLQNTPLSQSSSMPIEEVTPNEMLLAAATIGVIKAPGPDCIPNRALRLAVPTSAQRKTPPKKNKSSTPPSVLLVELGDILDEILYMVEEKKPAVRHINMDMKERLRRMKQIHQEVSAKLEKVPVSPQRTERCTNTSVSHETNRDGPVRRTTEAQPEIHVIDTTPPPEKPKWQKVVKRPKQLKHNSRPDAVMIKCKEKEAYAQVLKAVHGDGALQEYKDKVSGIRRTAAGEVLLRMTKASDETTGKLQKAIQSLIGDRGEVKALADKVALEIRDIAEWTTSDEVLAAVFKNIEGDISAESAPKLRPAYQGTQTATLTLPKDIAEHLLKLGKIRIGWSVCRLRTEIEPRRCYKCLSFGHIASRCRSKYDAAKLCFNCGGGNHAAKDCKSNANCILCKRTGEQNTAHSTLSKLCPRYLEAVRNCTN